LHQHLAYKPKSKWLAEMKKRHMAHHFHDETGNFGITTFFWDKLFGTHYDRPERPEKSPTVFNLGYTPESGERWPHVARLSWRGCDWPSAQARRGLSDGLSLARSEVDQGALARTSLRVPLDFARDERRW
jgi:hypothetical protein